MEKLALKILFLIFVSFCSGESILAQSIFQKDYIGSNQSVGYSIQTDSTGFMIVGTTSISGQGGKDVLIMKTDIDGNIIWAKTIGGPGNEVANCIKKTSDGGYIIVGSTSSYVYAPVDSSNFYIIKLDNSGNIQWTRSIGSFDVEVAKDVIETSDSKYAIVGFTKSIGPGNEDIYLMKLDSTGSLLWSYGMGSSGSDFGNSLIEASNGNIIIVGSTTGFSAGGQVPFLVETNSLGILQNIAYSFEFNTGTVTKKKYFTKIINGYFNDYVITGSDGVGSIGDAQHFILDIGQNLAVNWMKKYTLNSGEGVGTSIEKTPSGGFIIGGTMGIDHPALIKTDGIGQLIETKFFPDLSSAYHGKGLDVKSTVDGGIALLGYRYNSTDTSVYLVKTNNMLSSGCDENNGFSNIVVNVSPTVNAQIASSATGTNFIDIDQGIVSSAFPFMNVICLTSDVSNNLSDSVGFYFIQSGNTLNFQLSDPSDFIKSIKIFNIIGGEVKAINNSSEISNDLPYGLYFYQVFTMKKNRYAGKFVK